MPPATPIAVRTHLANALGLDLVGPTPDDDGQARGRKTSWQLRWFDGVRDEVLGRLLALNADVAERERLMGVEGGGGGKGGKGKVAKARAQESLF